MESLFAAQPTGFASFDGFTPQMTPEQQAQLLGQTLDASHIANLSKVPKQKPSETLPRYAGRKVIKYITSNADTSGQIKASFNPITAFQRYYNARTPGDNAKKALEMNGRAGEESAKVTMQYIRAAMSIASRASSTQIADAGLGPGIKAIHASVFPDATTTPEAAGFLAQLGKFMEREEMGEALVTYRMNDGVQDEAMRMLYEDNVQPGNNLIELQKFQGGSMQQLAAIRNAAASSIKFQRSMPHYSHIGSTPMHSVMKVAKQHRTLNGFKPRTNDRFLAV